MIIETLETKYEVIRYLYSDRHIERYICRVEDGDDTFTCIRIKEKKWIVSVMEFLMGQLENRDFTDLSACFVNEEHLYIMMRYTEGILLEEKLSYEETELEERLELAKAILDRLLLQNMPDYFMNDCLQLSRIHVSPGMSIGFEYELAGITDYEKTRFADVESRVAKIMELLFADELSKKTLPAMEKYIKSLKKNGYRDLMEMYTVYDELYKAILAMDESELVTPRTGRFRAWERFKKIMRPVKKIVAVLLILGSIGFLIWTAYTSSQDGNSSKVFEYIGSVEIK